MYSWIATTEEIDDIDEAIVELKSQLPLDELRKNTVGIAYVYFDTDFDELAQAFKDEFDFPVVGISAMALLGSSGYMECGIELMVMSADDVSFAIGMTKDLDSLNYDDEIGKVYNSIRHREKEELILAYGSKLLNHIGDYYMETFDRLSGGVMVYGGMPSDMFSYKDFRICFDGEVRTYAVAMILVYGNVKPVTAVELSVSNMIPLGKEVTKALGTTVYSIDDMPALDVLIEKGLVKDGEHKDSSAMTMEFMQTPFVVQIKVSKDESVQVLRNLLTYNFDTKAVDYVGAVPEGSSVKISNLKSDDIGRGVASTFRDFIANIKSSTDYKYSTILCTSCIARYMNLVGDKNIEGDAYKDLIPDDINLAGMYSFGEFCPQKYNDGKDYHNMFHNLTLTILAL